MYSCSCSRSFSISTFSASTLESFCCSVLVKNSSSCSTWRTMTSFSCLSRDRCLAFCCSLCSSSVFSLFMRRSSASTFARSSALSFSISWIRANSLFVTDSASASI